MLLNSLKRMADVQKHRGPDGEGIQVLRSGQGLVGLAHRRLAILDLSSLGHQPMENPETGDVIVYNGEIYNFRELRQELESCGLTFRSQSDTEVILLAYQQWGKGCLDRLRGMFAFALWDAHQQQILMARDHLGIKPLYYCLADNLLIFASEVRAFLVSDLKPFSIDPRAVAGYLAYGAVQEPLTILEGVRSLAPASWMSVDVTGHIRGQGTYWSIPPPTGTPKKPIAELAEEARSLLQQSVARHLISDVPIGVFLSSGLDSTTVLSLMHEIAPSWTRSFTVVFDDQPEYNEGLLARDTAQRLGIEHYECRITGETALEWAKRGMKAMDQPSMDGLNTYIISRAVREQGIVVALSGQGGDEIFGGYPSFRDVPAIARKLAWLCPIPAGLREAMARIVSIGKSESFRQKAIDMVRSGGSPIDLYFHRRRLCSNGQMEALGFDPNAQEGLTHNFQRPEVENADRAVEGDIVALVSRLESRFYLKNMLLRDGDVFGMANSLEIRVPLLDRDLVEWAYRLPGKTLLPPGSPSKPLLRQACADFFVGEIGVQGKRGFVLPLAKWMQGPLEEMVGENLEYMKNSGLIRWQGLQALRDDFQREPLSPIWSRIWAITTLGNWLKMNYKGFCKGGSLLDHSS